MQPKDGFTICLMMSMLFGFPGLVCAHEGLLIGKAKCISSSIVFITEGEVDFVVASDAKACILGFSTSTFEIYSIANSGNSKRVTAKVRRFSGAPLSSSGGWAVDHLVESGDLVDDRYETRYRTMARAASAASYSLPIFLYWNDAGVSRADMDNLLLGKSIDVDNELGTFRYETQEGLKRILIRKNKGDLFWSGGDPIEAEKLPGLKSPIESIQEEYVFTPPRRGFSESPFQCLGSIKYQLANGEELSASLEIQVTECGSANDARNYIDTLFSKLPSDQRIVSRSELTTVLDKGRQKVAIDLDVERSSKSDFSNSASIAYYAIASLLLFALGGWAYHRWSS